MRLSDLVEVLGISDPTGTKNSNHTETATINKEEIDTASDAAEDQEADDAAAEESETGRQGTSADEIVLTLKDVVISDDTREFIADVESVILSAPSLLDVS